MRCAAPPPPPPPPPPPQPQPAAAAPDLDPAPGLAPAEPGTPGRSSEGSSPVRALAFRLDTRGALGRAGPGGWPSIGHMRSLGSQGSVEGSVASSGCEPDASDARATAGVSTGGPAGMPAGGPALGPAGVCAWEPAVGLAEARVRERDSFDSLYEEANSLLKNLHVMRVKRHVAAAPLAGEAPDPAQGPGPCM